MGYSKHSLGICDRTGFRYKLKDLVFEVEHGRRNGLRVGNDVVDRDHPQNHQGTIKPRDDQSIDNARPDVAETAVDTSVFDNLYTHTAGVRS